MAHCIVSNCGTWLDEDDASRGDSDVDFFYFTDDLICLPSTKKEVHHYEALDDVTSPTSSGPATTFTGFQGRSCCDSIRRQFSGCADITKEIELSLFSMKSLELER
ncbi:hypothetical protein CAPTEDRAFT_186640 [Capitella teleta]|uniref:Uncharacterized protein n=1 Tax=Capitella teleta TaxID=283909 RepID=R7TWW1_CAPTE|nr:hypothetical protein CAPTEDRAFT_186640 [Capitella teleta]|eukprot:ELT95921.1 hypothetical protein CAPTEDRAFT_186640 [Capitella teleta]